MNPVEKNQADAWIVRVQGKEYGPVDLDELRDWKREGRLIRENEVRAADDERWFPAAELPEVFADDLTAELASEVVRQETRPDALLGETWRIYHGRFWQFLGLSGLVIVPSICAQFSSAAAGAGADGELGLRAALAGLFNFAMIVASLAGWPLYIASLQFLTRETAEDRAVTLAESIKRGAKVWWRVAVLCVLVYGAFFLLLMLAFAILATLVGGPPSLAMIFVALGLLIFQVWMFGRVFVNFLFWQQAAVLEDAGVTESLRRSKELAHSRRELSWWRRPKGRGAILASIWCLLATALSIGPEWSTLTNYFHLLATTHDPQAIMQSITASSQATGLALGPLVLGVIQAVLRPLLGISFVLLYLETK